MHFTFLYAASRIISRDVAMPDDDPENPDDVVDSFSSRPEARQRKKNLELANDFIRGLSLIIASYRSWLGDG